LSFLKTDISYLKGVGPTRAERLAKELNVKTMEDLLFIYPFRYIDKTQFQNIADLRSSDDVALIKGKIRSIDKVQSASRQSRLTALLMDQTGAIELIWFQKIKVISEIIKPDTEYIVYGKINSFGSRKSIVHPEMEEAVTQVDLHKTYDPIYSSTEKLDAIGLDSKGRRKLIKSILEKLSPSEIEENIPKYILEKLKFPSRLQAIHWIHFPKDEAQKILAQNRIKFEEFFFLQLQLLNSKTRRKLLLKGIVFGKVGENFNVFYKEKLPFELTNAQKRVMKEIRYDLGSGFQMNRLLQGDVGSGKTVVALMSMLLAIDNGFQSCLMAPTEILASQHFIGISELLKDLKVKVAYYTGSVKGKARKEILAGLEDGSIHIVIGTHALIEDTVVFKNLGLSITDEQHRFGVAQRARLWYKADSLPPHILVMTATPIPRTLAMTTYGDLDVSVIDELPPGRKEIKTLHKFEVHRPQVIEFMHKQIAEGRQIYVVYPLIEESETLDLQDLQQGYENLLQFFPPQQFQISVVHGRMKSKDKDFEMKRFVEKSSQIMVATTVIEVGVNVPNASVMIVENAERFGLSQLHQLRGRVGRGADQSFCILMSGVKLSKEAKQRIATMVRTNNGFEIAEADLQLRGPGEIEGTRQSGVTNFKLLNLIKDHNIVSTARHLAEKVLEADPNLASEANAPLRKYLLLISKPGSNDWGLIS
jgi:ATP-dependent DNA helicase RecG